MQIQDIYNNLYSSITGKSRFWSPIRFFIRILSDMHISLCFKLRPTNKFVCQNNDIIVSLTSFPARINNLWLVIECILRQTVKPSRIVLWLSKEQFSCTDNVPSKLRSYMDKGLDIRLVDGDIRSHKKYYYAFEEFNDKKVILIDDDIYYHSTLIENLLAMEEKHKKENVVVCTYAYYMRYDENGNLLPYNSWYKDLSKEEECSSSLFFGSGGGTLIKPSLLTPEWSNLDKALELTPLADDIWLNAMIRLSSLRIVKTKGKIVLPVHSKNDVKLKQTNVYQNQNDVQLNNVISYYRDKKTVFLFSK